MIDDYDDNFDDDIEDVEEEIKPSRKPIYEDERVICFTYGIALDKETGYVIAERNGHFYRDTEYAITKRICDTVKNVIYDRYTEMAAVVEFNDGWVTYTKPLRGGMGKIVTSVYDAETDSLKTDCIAYVQSPKPGYYVVSDPPKSTRFKC